MTENKKTKPTIKLTGEDGNAFFILGRCQKKLRDEDFSEEQIAEFMADATSGNYDHLLQTCMKWFDVK